MCSSDLGQQNANARYNTLTSFLDAALLWLLLPRLGLGGYYFSFAASHLLNFALSLRRLTLAADIRPEPGKPALAAVCTAAAAAAASLTAGNGSLLAPGGCYLLLLGTLWCLFRVAGKEDVQWLMSLIAGRCRS